MLDIFQSRVPVAVLAFEKLEELQMYFATHEQSNNAFEQHLTTAEDVPYEQKQVVIATVKHAVGNCQEKLSKYMDLGGGQPGIEYMRACRLLNPRNCAILSKEPARYYAIPMLRDVPQQEFDLYMNTLGPQYVAEIKDVNIIQFWKGIEHRIPCLAKAAMATVCSVLNSADAERSNSIYNLVLKSRRRSLLPNTIRQLVFMYHNQRVTCGALEKS